MLKASLATFVAILAVTIICAAVKLSGSTSAITGLLPWAAAAAMVWALVAALAILDAWDPPKKVSIAGLIAIGALALGAIIFETASETIIHPENYATIRILTTGLIIWLIPLALVLADELRRPEYIMGRHHD